MESDFSKLMNEKIDSEISQKKAEEHRHQFVISEIRRLSEKLFSDISSIFEGVPRAQITKHTDELPLYENERLLVEVQTISVKISDKAISFVPFVKKIEHQKDAHAFFQIIIHNCAQPLPGEYIYFVSDDNQDHWKLAFRENPIREILSDLEKKVLENGFRNAFLS